MLMAAVSAAKAASYGSRELSQLSESRKRALEAYYGYNTNPAPEGRSQIVDRSVYETVHTILPALVRIFASSSEQICKFVPVGPEDEQAADQTTEVINHVVTQLNPWEQICGDWIHDALLMPNSYAMAYWDESKRVIRERYDGQSEDQLIALVSDKSVKVLEHSQYPDEQTNADNAEAFRQAQQQYQQMMGQWEQVAQQAQAAGQPIPPEPPTPQPPQPATLHDVVIEREETEGKVCISVLPPEHCYVGQDTPDWTLRHATYFEVTQEKSIGDLRAMGLDVPDDISDDEELESLEDEARDRFVESDEDGDETGAARRVWARMIWIKADVEGDGITRLYYILAVGKTPLYVEPAARIPVAAMTHQPLPHRHPGMSLAETCIDTQEVKTAIKRGGLDNLYLANNGRHVVSSRVNVADMLDSRPGGLVRMLDDSLPSEGHVVPLVHPFAFDSIINSLEYFDQERQNRTGAMRGAAGLEANALNKAAVGTTVAMQNSSAQRVEHIARVMAPAVEYLFDVVMETIAKHQNKPLTLKLRNQWVTVDPQAWRTRRDVKISVGVGAGNKESMMQQLGQIYMAQMQLLPMGVAGPKEIHATVTEMAKLAGFSNPGKFWVEPQGPMQMPPDPETVKANAAMQELQFKAEQDAMKFQAEQQAEQQKFQAMQVLEQQKLQMQAELDRNREELDARQKALEAEQKAALELQKAQLQQQADAAKLEMERYKAELDAAVKLQIAGMSQQPQQDSRIDQLMQMLQTLADGMNAPAEIVRGPDGRAIGIKRGEVVRKIQRGPDGRAAVIQ